MPKYTKELLYPIQVPFLLICGAPLFVESAVSMGEQQRQSKRTTTKYKKDYLLNHWSSKDSDSVAADSNSQMHMHIICAANKCTCTAGGQDSFDTPHIEKNPHPIMV